MHHRAGRRSLRGGGRGRPRRGLSARRAVGRCMHHPVHVGHHRAAQRRAGYPPDDAVQRAEQRHPGAGRSTHSSSQRAAAVPHRPAELPLQPSAARRWHRASDAAVRSCRDAAGDQRLGPGCYVLLWRSCQLPLHGTARAFRHRRPVSAGQCWGRGRTDLDLSARYLGAAWRGVAAGLRHDRDRAFCAVAGQAGQGAQARGVRQGAAVCAGPAGGCGWPRGCGRRGGRVAGARSQHHAQLLEAGGAHP